MSEIKNRYSKEELKEFKALLEEKLAQASKELKTYKNAISKTEDESTDGTLSVFRGLEDGANTAEKESLNQLAARQSKYIQNLERALIRIQNGTYGICKVTGKLISKERLRLVPHTTESIESKNSRR